MTKKTAWIAVGLVLFALVWAALHDIIQGREPDLRAEYSVVLLAALGLLAWATLKLLRSRSGKMGR